MEQRTDNISIAGGPQQHPHGVRQHSNKFKCRSVKQASSAVQHIHFVTSAHGESKRSHAEATYERKGDDDIDDESDETTSAAKPPNQADGKRSAKPSRKSEAPPAAAA